MSKVVLASGSPRRQEMMKRFGIDFICKSPDIQENLNKDLAVEDAVIALAKEKALAIYKKYSDSLVIGFDTIVVLDDEIMGKPKNLDEAMNMLTRLSGNTHRVITGCAFFDTVEEITFYSDAYVTFSEMTQDEIEDYVMHNDVLDKAGAYAIQDDAAKYIEHIKGDYYAVIGFPINKIYQTLKNKNCL